MAAVGLTTPAASTDDPVSIVVTDATGQTHQEDFNLTSADLGTTGSATVTKNVMTDLALPPKSVDILVVDGVVYRDDMTTPVDSGFNVTVTVGADDSQTTSTLADGSFSATFLEIPPMTVATTGDTVSIVVTDSADMQRGAGDLTLTHLKLGKTDSATVTIDVHTDIGATSKLFNIVGTVNLKDGYGDKVPAMSHLREGDLTVVVTNASRNDLEASAPVDDNGEYAATLINLTGIAVETGDNLTVEVKDQAGVTVGKMPHVPTTPEILAAPPQATVNVDTEVPAKVGLLEVVGTVVDLEDNAAGAGLRVTITLGMNGQTMSKQRSTDSSGRYEAIFFEPPATAATTGGVLVVKVERNDGYHGRAEINPLMSSDIYRSELEVDPIKLLPPTKALGGLSINPQYLPEDLKRISREAIQINPALLNMLPSGILYLDLLKGFAGFDPTDNIEAENFGNAITPRPAWHVLGDGSPADQGRWFNGDRLNLYVLTGPTATNVDFTLSGPTGSKRAEATPIAAGDTVPYTFQLEEERAILFLPSWDGMSVFDTVNLMINEQAIPMEPNMDTGIWEAEAPLTPGSTVSYYYQVTLAQPYEVNGKIVSNWAMPDPRNLQVQDLGIVESLLAPELGPDLVEIVTTMNLQLRSVLNVPAVNSLQFLWVHPFDLSDEGVYQLDTKITHRGTTVDTTNSNYADFVEDISTQTFMVDRSAPTADLTLSVGEGSGLYKNPDGSYVAASRTDGGTLTITAIPIDPMDPGAYLYQIISLDAEGDPGVNVWNPATLTTDLALTYMGTHKVTLPIGGENSLIGHFGLRAVGIDSILNISSSTKPTMLKVVPLESDNAEVTVVHADYMTDGRSGREQQVSDGVKIFSDRSAVTLTLEIAEPYTGHPLKSIKVDFQIDGAGDWKPIKHFTKDELDSMELAAGSELTVNWDRTEDFAEPTRHERAGDGSRHCDQRARCSRLFNRDV